MAIRLLGKRRHFEIRRSRLCIEQDPKLSSVKIRIRAVRLEISVTLLRVFPKAFKTRLRNNLFFNNELLFFAVKLLFCVG